MKSIWKGAINFGLVNIPIKLYSAVENSSLDFDMLDKSDLAPIKFKRVNEHTQKEVAYADIVKGYFYNDQYVVLDQKDFEAASPEKSKILELDQFVDISEIDSIYFSGTYYIEPEKSGVKAYSLLLESLKKSKKAGIGKFVLRTTESVVVVQPYKNLLIASKIHFSEEIRDTKELKIGKSDINEKEVKMALSLIEQYSEPFDPAKFKNEYSADLLKIIEEKSKGKKVKVAPLKVTHKSSDDLMEQLKASLSKGKKQAS